MNLQTPYRMTSGQKASSMLAHGAGKRNTGNTCMRKGQYSGQKHIFTPVDLRIKFCEEQKAREMKGIPSRTLFLKIRRHADMKGTIDNENAF